MKILYLEASDYPSEDVQFEAYRTVARKMEARPVIIRTMDIGADKQAEYFDLPHEQNPALGMRAIRLCLKRPNVFKTQIKAILKASIYGNLAIMLPVITSLWEVRKAKEIINQVKNEMVDLGVSFDPDIKIGIMIETPAAAIISDILAEEVDFFSIGTNDLTQYTLAIDRMNDSVDEFCDVHHESVLRLIRTVVQNAHEKGIWVGICGELGSDMFMAKKFIEWEVDELSVNPSSILLLKRHISKL